MTVDKNGQVYITGETGSQDFPLHNPIQTFGGYYDVFVSKLASNGNNLIFSTFIGGTENEGGYDIDVDDENNVYITGLNRIIRFSHS